MGRVTVAYLPVALAVCAPFAFASCAHAGPHDELVAKHAAANGVPEQLVHRVIRIESRGNAAAIHDGNYGLMQIRLQTAKGMGYAGDARGLLDADTNLTYAVRYLAGAYRAAGCNADRAVAYYQRGYYGAPQRECAEPVSSLLQPGAKTKREGAKPRADAAPAPSQDVIKPKVVRTETIVVPKPGDASAPAGNVEPSRVAPPVAAANPRPAETTAKSDRLNPVAVVPTLKFELVSVPLPPVRSEPDAALKQEVQPVHRGAGTSARAGKKSKTEAKTDNKANSETKTDWRTKTDDPFGVVALVKKIVTPDKKPGKPVAEAQAAPPLPSPMHSPE
jgi:hypothetical protein